MICLDDLHAGQRGQRRPVRRRLHAHHRAERRGVPRQNGSAEFFNRRNRLRRVAREQAEGQHRAGGQRILLHGRAEQRQLEFVIRLVGNHRLHRRLGGQPARAARREAHEVGVVRDVGNDFRARRRQQRAERGVDRPARLDDVSARIALRLQVRREGEVNRQARINQRVLQQDRAAVAGQLSDVPGRVAQAVGQPVGLGRRGAHQRWIGQGRRAGQPSRRRRSRGGNILLRRPPARRVPEQPRARHTQQAQRNPDETTQTHKTFSQS